MLTVSTSPRAMKERSAEEGGSLGAVKNRDPYRSQRETATGGSVIPLGPRRLATLCGILMSAFFSRSAFASPNDAEAVKLRQAAIEQDYLATDFASAAKKLGDALALCKASDDCTAATRARLHCDLAVVYVAQEKKADADAEFASAVREDPNVAISTDLTTPELRAELASVKASASGHPATTPVAAAPVPPAGAPIGAPTEPAAAPKKAPPAPPPRPAAPPTRPPASSEADCPPGLPGCKSAPPMACSTNDDCPGGERCDGGQCIDNGAESAARPARSNWISLGVEQDFLFLPSASKVCAGGSGYTCFASNGAYYAQTPLTGPGTADSVNGGLALATTRVLLGYDRAFGSNVTLGARVGFAVGAGPKRPNGAAFFPAHLEARAAYYFGRNALARPGFRPLILVAVGAAEVDASLSAYVYNQNAAPGSAPSQYQAWKKAGQGFAAVGLGSMFAFGSDSGIVVEVRGMEMFPTSAPVLAALLGYAIGL